MCRRFPLIVIALCFLGGCDGMLEMAKKVGVEKTKADEGSGYLAALRGTGTGNIVTMTAANFDAVVDQPGKLVIVDFWAPWCQPCLMLDPVLREIAAEHPDTVILAKVNVDEVQALADRFQVRAIPDLHFFKGGIRVERITGAPQKPRIEAVIRAHAGTPATRSGTTPEPSGEPSVQPMRKDWMPPGLERR